jgi:hypothetical protein
VDRLFSPWFRRAAFIGSLAKLVLLVATHTTYADGGLLRLSQRSGELQITIFTSPTPLRAGRVDVSVLVQNAESLEPLTQVPVTVQLIALGATSPTDEQVATNQAATNKLLQAAELRIPRPGKWNLLARVDSAAGVTEVACEVEVANALPRWITLWPWIAWPASVIMLFAAHQWLVRRKTAKEMAIRN